MNNHYNSDLHHRHSIRLKGYDYSQAGAYFVTICVHERECLFGEIVDGAMQVNEFGRITAEEWTRTAEIRKEIELGDFVVMPNHFHGILIFPASPSRKGTTRHAPMIEQFGKPVAGSLPTIVRAFKSAVTKRINIFRETPGYPVWQRDYYEHIIRNDADSCRITDYIATNPQRWAEDTLHPDNMNIEVASNVSNR